MPPKIVAVVARTRNNIIGADGGMPWRISSDLKHFKKLTMGRPMIMGRQTFESIGKALPGRETVVLTRNPSYAAPGAHVATNPQAALDRAEHLAREMGAAEIIIAGGEDVFRLFLDRTDVIELTEIDLEIDGDTRFPALDPAQWREIARETPERGPRDDADFAYVTLARKTVAGGPA